MTWTQLTASLIALSTCFGSVESSCEVPQRFVRDTHDLLLKTNEGSVLDARITVPDEKRRNGWGVLLIGGGLGNDLNWTVPAFQQIDGRKEQLTLSGEPHQDAPRLAKALADRGFIVLHWSTIRRDDPHRDSWPNAGTVYSPSELLQQAHAALNVLRTQQFGRISQVVLLGHSLGAVRAANLAVEDGQIAGLVLLAPAQLARTSHEDRGRNMNRDTVSRLFASIDTDADGTCSRAELQAWRENSNAQTKVIESFDALDFDRDGFLRPWEFSAGFARENRRKMNLDLAARTDSSGLLWTEDILRSHKISTLILYGALDNAQAHHAPIIAEMKKNEALNHIDFEVLPQLGHQLGQEENGRIAPIDDRALSRIGQWLEKLLTTSRNQAKERD